jgi:hypothetical protein
MLSLTKLLHSPLGQISAIISDDAMWISKAKNQLLQEFDCCGCITIADRLGLNPLGEFMNSDQKMGFLVLGRLKRTNHNKPPDCKGPSYWDHPELLSRNMSLACKLLATITLLYDILSICVSRKLVKTMPKSFCH